MRKRPGRIAVTALLCIAGVSACGASEDTAGPERGVTVADIQEPDNFYEGDYLGQQVTVSAAVTDVLTPTSLELAGAEYGEDSLLVQTPMPVNVQTGQVIRVTGTVGQYHRVIEGVPPVQYDMYEEYETEAYIYDATVEPLPA